ncbi:pyridoxamine 5'-phosphate oxidase family protein [Mycolicibacterium sp.]|uniref:pyridoxamine 5'-phosphate oxidase family protein n=1 Tax=Mycolicibacterium sp. TaxID=2320850 RepID=UPI001A19ADC8|nr:pyridoxamine 5'-phosphate oxidase family protein [Mycolicibacterium sp.]MBJ7336133.1 pyridoxamine 5'-phosphate oxidase family protein [Mycolicibacterium sp.]
MGFGDNGDVLTAAESHFLESVGRGRLVTIGRDEAPQVHPVPFVVDGEGGSIEISGPRLRESRKYANVRRDPRVSLIVDDPSLPLRGFDDLTGRGVEIHGFAELAERSGRDIIRIRPVRVDRWNLDDTNGHQSRFIT